MTPELHAAIIVKHGALALLGGIVHALSAYRRGETRGPLDILVLATISSFTGVIFAFLALNLYPQGYFTFAVAGVGGFIGVEGMAWITDLVKKKLQR